ncbi:stress-inducible protein [Actinidia rufa]|uniref:Stress-inducible protein n=1 Tax=Actinidia rufa TaxID=165716 RepID=A0A7J0DE21_9ERIC|nr:stress-inducible protein [Actinidia rufa]
MGLRRYDDAVSAYKNGLEIDPNNEALKSGLAAASGTHFTSPFGDVFSGSEIWARLESDPTTRVFLQQGDFKNKMLDVQENPSTLNRHLKDPRIVQALGVLLNVKLRRPNSAEDAGIPDVEMTEEEPEPEDMEVEERGSERAREKARKMLLLLRGRDEAAAAEEEEAFEGGPSRARHREDMERLATSENCCVVGLVIGLLLLLSKGNEFFKEQNYLEAVKHYAEAIKRNPNGPKAYRNRAACYIKLGAMPEGLKDAEKCIELDLSFARGYSRKGTIQFFMKEYDKALEMYQEGLKHEPRNQELLDGVPRNRYWGLHPPPAPLENVVDDGLMAVQRAVFLKKAGVETAVDDVFLLNPPNRADLLELAIENIIRYLHVSRDKYLTPSVKEGVDTLLMYLYRALNRVEDMERLATSENCCLVVCAILLLPFAFVAF